MDLDSRAITFQDVAPETFRRFLGGAGLGAKILWDRVKPTADPLGPENELVFTPGLLTDTGSVFTGRFTVLSLSPASRGLGDANCGGYFSPFLKRCRIDALCFRGASASAVYLYIDQDKAELVDASDLWGKDTIETETELKKRHGQSAQVACIGRAGELRSFISGICTDGGRIAARSGLGAVMGSKRLKAVVAAGKARISVADEARVKELTNQFRERLKKYDFLERVVRDDVLALAGKLTGKPVYLRQPAVLWRAMLKKMGTPSLTAICVETGDSPVKNWAGDVVADFPSALYRKISGDQVITTQTKKYGCYSCPVRCGGHVTVTGGPYPIEKMHKPEYETTCAFGDMLLNNDLPSIFKMNDLVNRGGMDSISCGGVLAFAVECFVNGIITEKDTGGLRLNWGNADALVKLTGMIVNREGIGDFLADGVKLAAERIGNGSERFAVHCGGIEPPMHDPKFDPGLAATFSCEATPGRHTISCGQFLELQGLEHQFQAAVPVPIISSRRQRYRPDDKGPGLAVGAFYKMLVDAAGACLFGTHVGADLPLCEWMNAATGWSFTNDQYLTTGERIDQLRHAFNVRRGINPLRDYRLHPRLFGDPPLTSGPLKGVRLDVATMAGSYYRAMNWDTVTGLPDLTRLRELGLDEVIEYFYPAQRGGSPKL